MDQKKIEWKKNDNFQVFYILKMDVETVKQYIHSCHISEYRFFNTYFSHCNMSYIWYSKGQTIALDRHMAFFKFMLSLHYLLVVILTLVLNYEAENV